MTVFTYLHSANSKLLNKNLMTRDRVENYAADLAINKIYLLAIKTTTFDRLQTGPTRTN